MPDESIESRDAALVLRREAILPAADRGRLAAIVATCSLAGLAGGMALSMLAETQRAAQATRVPSRPLHVQFTPYHGAGEPLAWLGVTIRDRSAHACSGATVREVVPASPAAREGVRVGDVILAYGGDRVCGADHLVQVVGASAIGATPEIVVERGAERFVYHPTLVERPAGR